MLSLTKTGGRCGDYTSSRYENDGAVRMCNGINVYELTNGGIVFNSQEKDHNNNAENALYYRVNDQQDQEEEEEPEEDYDKQRK